MLSLAVAAVGLLLAARSALALFEGISSRAWPEVPGVLLDVGVDSHSGARQATKLFHLRYGYTVADRTYEGHRFSLADTYRDPNDLLSQVTAPGLSVRVFYDPRHPDHSVLQAGCPPVLGLPLAFGLFVSLSSSIYFLRKRKETPKPPRGQGL